jgi:adenosine deaminase
VRLDREWLRALPKAELHVHLEGTVRPSTFARIANRNGVDVVDLEQLFKCSDFNSFLKAFTRVAQALQQPDDLAEVTDDYLSLSAEQGVKHVEFFFSPATIRHFHPESDLMAIVQAINAVSVAARKATGISSLLIFDMVRNLGDQAAFADIDLAERCSPSGVVGIGLGGDERKFPARDFGKPFAHAAHRGLRRTVHAGEADGAQSVRDAVEILHAERIGHGVTAIQDPKLLALIAERGIAIDSCLTSNQITGASSSHAEHPLKDFMAAGISATLSSDDPSFFGASLLDEYELAAGLGFTRAELATLARNSFEKSFAPEGAKRKWIDELDQYLQSALSVERQASGDSR